MGERHKFDALIVNLGECVLGSSDIGWSTEVEAESEAEAFELRVAEAVSVSESEGLPPHGIKTSEEDIRRLLIVRRCSVYRTGNVFRIMVPPRGEAGLSRTTQSSTNWYSRLEGSYFAPGGNVLRASSIVAKIAFPSAFLTILT